MHKSNKASKKVSQEIGSPKQNFRVVVDDGFGNNQVQASYFLDEQRLVADNNRGVFQLSLEIGDISLS